MKSSLLRVLAVVLATVTGAAGASPTPAVAVSVKPIHSLVASVMDGVGTPALLVQAAGSPHSYSLRPSEARALGRARLVFWVGEPLEAFLAKPLAALAGRAEIVELAEVKGMTLLAGRAGGVWESHATHGAGKHAHEAAGRGGPQAQAQTDGHLWLDPENARRIVEAAAGALGRVDPLNRERYEENARKTLQRIGALGAELGATLAPARDIPYVVFHDAYQYLEHRYGLRAVGSVTATPDRKPGARRIAEMRAKIRDLGARCVFAEPQFEPSLVATLVEGTGARTGTLDPLGADLAAGPDAYFTLMRNLARSLAACLGGS